MQLFHSPSTHTLRYGSAPTLAGAFDLLPTTHIWVGEFTMRPYTRGAEKLFHRVDWDRAVGLVVVVDPFDPGSLLYLPQAGYIDLIKTALANRSPLVVVHGLNDEVPIVNTIEDTTVKPSVWYRTYTIAGVVVHSVPTTSQNSPPPSLSPTTAYKKQEFPEDFFKVRKGPKGTGGKGADKDSSGSKGDGEPYEGLRTLFGLLVSRALRGNTNELHRSGLVPTRPRVWTKFVADQFLRAEKPHTYFHIPDLKWPSEAATAKRRPLANLRARSEVVLLHMFTWVGATILARSARSLQWAFAILGTFVQIWQHNGLKVASSHFAEARRILMKYLSGVHEDTSQSVLPLAIDKHGLPTLLPKGLRAYIRGGHVVAIRLAFFMLNVCDILKYETKPKIGTITDPYKGVLRWSPELDDEIRLAVEDLVEVSGSRPSRISWKSFHTSVKAGPFGTAMISAPLDAVALEASEVYEHFADLCKMTPGGKRLLSHTTWLAWATRTLMKVFWSGLLGTLPVGKASQVIEPRGKIRVVAIPGYQIQSLLRPLHMALYDFLKEIPSDHTFNQDNGVKRAMVSEMKTMHSFDLSAATDRFPIWFEEAVLKHLLSNSVKNSKEYAKAWTKLLQGLKFSFRYTRKGRLHWLTYGSGQPMGTYSSWASFAVSHHVLTQIAARRAGIAGTMDYELLGDDILLRGDTAEHAIWFRKYLDLMRDLGVGINPSKGVSSTNSSFEFAKRFIRGTEVLSSLRWKELASVENWRGVFSLFIGMTRRGLPLPHLRVALEVGWVLVTKLPFSRDLTNPRRVNIVRLPALREAILLLTSPVGPYKVPLVAWLSGRGAFLVDFHPNLGHFINNIDRIYMGYDIQYPIAIGLKSVRQELIKRALAVESTARGTLRSLQHTILSVKEKVCLDPSGLLWNFPDSTSISESMRSIDFSRFETLTELFQAVGTTAKLFTLSRRETKKEGNLSAVGQKVLGFNPISFKVHRTAVPLSTDLMIGLLRTIVTMSPAHIQNVRGLTDLLRGAPNSAVQAFDPDRGWAFGSNPDEDLATGQHAQLDSWISEWSEGVVPKDFSHPAQLLDQCRECITDYIKVSVADILPGALPRHMDLFETLNEVLGFAVIKTWRSLRESTLYEEGTIYTLPEGTLSSRPPTYLLEYTNSIRLDSSQPDLIPRVGALSLVPKVMAVTPECIPLIQPDKGYEKLFSSELALREKSTSPLLNSASSLSMFPGNWEYGKFSWHHSQKSATNGFDPL